MMKWFDSLQDVLTVLDQFFPWLLPSMESIERIFPVQARLLVCAFLVLWLVSRVRPFADGGMRLEPGS